MRKQKSHLLKNLKKEYVSYLMLLPNWFMFIMFVIYPLGWIFRYMFFEYKGYGEAVFVGLENFVRVFTRDEVFWDAVQNTLIYVGGKLVLTIPISFLLALLLYKNTKANAVAQSIVFMPTIMSSAVMALIFYLLFNTYNGDVNRYLMKLGLIQENVNWLGVDYAMLIVIIVAVWGALGNYMVYFIAGFTGVSQEVIESAKLDGANGIVILFRIILPMMGPIIKMILMLALVNSFLDMQSIMVLTEGGPMGRTNVIFLYVYQLFFPITAGSTIPQEFGYGAAVSFVAACIVGMFTGVYLFLARKLDRLTE